MTGGLSGEQGEQVANIDATHIPVELRGFTTRERLPLVVAEHGAIGCDECVGAQLVEFGFHALPVGFGEAPEIEVVAGEVFEACQIEGCRSVVAGWGVELGEVVGDLLHHDSFSGDGVLMVLSGGCDKDGVYVDHVDEIVEFSGLVLGEWLPAGWPV